MIVLQVLVGIVVGVYEFGAIAALVVLWRRAGIQRANTGVDWREFLLPNLVWLLVYWFGKALVWPVVLYQWNDAGRPTSAWRAVTELGGRPARAIVRTGT